VVTICPPDQSRQSTAENYSDEVINARPFDCSNPVLRAPNAQQASVRGKHVDSKASKSSSVQRGDDSGGAICVQHRSIRGSHSEYHFDTVSESDSWDQERADVGDDLRNEQSGSSN
jgi:hypothetical protein